jgi:hypothetical protein
VISLLENALQLLQQGFCRGASAENKYGREVPLTWSTATAWSVSGAICRASWDQGIVCFDPRQERAFEAIEAVTGSHLGRWEAHAGVTQEKALEVVRLALDNLRKET